MAPKRPLPAEDPPPASRSDDESSVASEDKEPEEEEEEGSESESEDSEDEDDKEEQKKPLQPKPSPPPPPPQQQQQQQRKSQGGSSSTGSSSESDSDSGSDSESESESRRYTVKPIASKPIANNETPPAKKARSEPPSSSTKQPSAKRKVEVEESKDSKKGKKKDAAENGSVQKSGEESKKQKSGEESKKPMFQRIWGDNDEIALLRGMIDFREKKGMDPSANTNAFHDYVKKLLGQEFTASQLANKIRVLKKKYTTNEGKGKDGEDRAFSKPHEQKVFELSKKIWGGNKSSDAGGSGDQTPMLKANGTARKSKTAGTSSKSKSEVLKLEASQERSKEDGELIPFEHGDTVSMLSFDEMLQVSKIGLNEDFLKKGWAMVDESKREEFKERWRKLQLAEMRVLAERTALIQFQTNLVLEAYHQATEK